MSPALIRSMYFDGARAIVVRLFANNTHTHNTDIKTARTAKHLLNETDDERDAATSNSRLTRQLLIRKYIHVTSLHR